MTKILITGASGHVGSTLATRAKAAGFEIHGTQSSPGGPWHQLDVSNSDAVRSLVTTLDPDLIIHTAAGRHPDDFPVIAYGTAHVSEAARQVGARLIHISTDAVFGGDQAPYTETARPAPINAYGKAKAAAEQAVSPDDLIVRISLVLGGSSKHEQAVHKPGFPHYTNVLRSPLHVDDLADALIDLARGDTAGVVHLAGADDLSRHDLARLVAERDGLDPSLLATGLAAQPYPLDTRLRSLRRPPLRGAREFLRPR